MSKSPAAREIRIGAWLLGSIFALGMGCCVVLPVVDSFRFNARKERLEALLVRELPEKAGYEEVFAFLARHVPQDRIVRFSPIEQTPPHIRTSPPQGAVLRIWADDDARFELGIGAVGMLDILFYFDERRKLVGYEVVRNVSGGL